jgi:hypothetical protein
VSTSAVTKSTRCNKLYFNKIDYDHQFYLLTRIMHVRKHLQFATVKKSRRRNIYLFLITYSKVFFFSWEQLQYKNKVLPVKYTNKFSSAPTNMALGFASHCKIHLPYSNVNNDFLIFPPLYRQKSNPTIFTLYFST